MLRLARFTAENEPDDSAHVGVRWAYPALAPRAASRRS
jgi:hypothetical protein